MQRRDALPVDAGTDEALVALIQDVREVRVQDGQAGGDGVVEAGEAVEFAYARVDADLQGVEEGGVEGLDGWIEGLEAAVEGRGIDCLDGWGEGGEVRGEVVGLFDTVRGEGGVGGDAGWGWEGVRVGASLRIYDPVGAELRG